MQAECLGSRLEKVSKVKTMKAQTQNVQHFLGSPDNLGEEDGEALSNGLDV